MHAIYQGLSKRQLYKEYVRRNINNASGFNLCRNFAFACTPSLSPRVITWLESANQLKNQYLASYKLQKNMLPQWALDLSPQMVMWYWSAVTLFWQLSNNYNMDVQYQRCSYGSSATLLFFKVQGLEYRCTYGCTDGRTDVIAVFNCSIVPYCLRKALMGKDNKGYMYVLRNFWSNYWSSSPNCITTVFPAR